VTDRSESGDAAVLVVDDDLEVRQLATLALRRAGYVVLEAANGRAALDMINAGNIGVVVLDVGMPEMSGTQVVEALRRHPETATLPILLMTGSGGDQGVIEGLAAGADDFLAKPVRLDELVARVHAHLRNKAAWSERIADELQARRNVVAALAGLRPSTDPEETAENVIMELAKRIESDFLAVLQLDQDGRLIELATYNRTDGIRRGGVTLPSELASTLIAHAESGPWLDELGLADDVRTASFASADMAIAAGAPIYADDQLVGLLSIGIRRTAEPPSRVRRAQLLAAAIDYASVLSAMAGPAMADRRVARANQTELKRSLAAREFHPVFQPIIDLDSKNIAGYEALTRFDDGTPPDLRFAEAARAGLGSDYELAAIRAAVLDSEGIPPGPFLSLNISPAVLINDGHRLSQLIRGIVRPVVIELTEHTPIADYPTLLAAIARLGEVSMAVDDAGAGFASLRHILELKPAYVKLDISLVRGIDQDATRQALAAGLQYFAIRTDFRLIAEGVETTAEVDALRLIGVDLAQGYLFGRPEPVS
jgi:EAL domain-containing protein (putative c-di-GMP-specific phosphodiesterase class I)/DNA-binding response OmpR family regulator